MKKLLAKIIGATTALAMAIGVGFAVGNNRTAKQVDAAAQSVSWTATSGGLGTGIGSGTITTGGYSWSYTRTLISGTSYSGWTSNCIQLGKNGGVENLTLTTSSIPGMIKSVSVECSSYSGAHKVAISVGGDSYLSATNTATWTTVNAKSGTGTSSGTIIISFTDGSRALYVKSITVSYDAGGEEPPEPTGFTVSFNANGGGSSMSDVSDVTGDYTLPANGFTAPSGKAFIGWKANNAGDLLAVGANYEVTTDVTFYAQWEDRYTVKYNYNGGSGTITDSSSPYVPSSTVTVKSNTGFTAPFADMVFDKWNTAADGSGQNYDPGDTFEISENTTLYAQWIDDPSIPYTNVYSTGFESTEGFTSTTTYNSEKDDGPSGRQWHIYYGTASTGSPLAGSQSLQMRWYGSAPSNHPYIQTNFALNEVKRVTFNYKVSNKDVDFKTQYSTDGGVNWTDIDTVDTPNTNEHTYRKIFADPISSLSFKILVCEGTAPSGTAKPEFRIDNVSFDSIATPASINGVDEVNVGTQWSPTSITEDESGNPITGAAFAFATSNGAVISASNPSTGAFTASHDGTVTVSATKSGYLIASKAVTVNPVDASIVVPTASTTGYTGQNESIAFTYANIVNTVVVTSNNPSVVTISSLSCNAGSGTVQFNFVGVGTTTVSFKDGETELDSVSVTVSLSQVTITGLPASKEVFVGRTLDLGSIVTVEAVGNCTDAVTWESGDEDIVIVDDSGTILGVDVGTTNVTVSADDYPSASLTCAVTVSEVPQDAYIVDFGLAKKSDASSLSNDSGFKTAYSFDDEEEVTFSGFDKIYGEANKMLKLGSNKNAATLTITIPSYSYISYVEMVVGETPNGITLSVTSGAAEARPEEQTLAVGKLTFNDHLASEKSNSVTFSSDVAGAFYLENLIIHYVNAKDQVERLNTQTTLSYHYSSNGNGEYEYSNVAIRFGGFMSQDLWGQLDTNEHNIDGYGVLLTTDAWISNDSDVATAYSLAAESAEITDYYSGNITPTPKSVPSEATAAQKTAHGVEGDYYIWNLYLDIDEADYDTTFVGVAYIKLKNGTVVFMKKASFSVYSLAADYIANRGYNGSAAGGSLGDLASHA